jgi:hypothetical protein
VRASHDDGRPPAGALNLSPLGFNDQVRIYQTLLQQRQAVVAPEWLVIEEKQRHAENIVGASFPLRTIVGVRPRASEMIAVFTR